MKRKRMMVVGAVVFGVAAVRAADVYWWKGSAGDHKWSTADNWAVGSLEGDTATEAPTNGQDVWLVGYAGETIINDVDGVTLNSLHTTNQVDTTHPVMLIGKPLTLSATYKCYTRTTNEVGLVFTTTSAVSIYGANNYNVIRGGISAENAISLTFSNARDLGYDCPIFNVYGAVNVPKGSVRAAQGNSATSFYGPVTAVTLYSGQYYGNGHVHLYAIGNNIGTVYASKYNICNFNAANGFVNNPLLCWDWNNDTDSNGETFRFYGDLTIDHFESTTLQSAEVSNVKRAIGAASGISTVTMKATTNSNTSASYNDKLSLVWDPQGDYTFMNTNRISTMTGTITVKRGRMVVAGTANFTKLTGITVEDGAAFEAASTSAATTFPLLTTLTLGRNARFDVTNTTSTVFAQDVTLLVLAEGAKLYIGRDIELKFTGVNRDGVYLASTNFSAATCDWIEGEGTVTTPAVSTLTSWKTPADGDWSTEANWSHGVPAAGKETYLTIQGGTYTARVDVASLVNGRTTLGNTDGNESALLVGNDLAIADGNWLQINAGGAYVQTNGVSEFRNTAEARRTTVNEGGLWRLEGTATNRFLTSDSGFFTLAGGRIEIADQAELYFENIQHAYNQYSALDAGRIDISGNGVLKYSSAQNSMANNIRDAEIIVRDNAKFVFTYASFASKANGEFRLVVTNNASYRASACTYVGYNGYSAVPSHCRQIFDFHTDVSPSNYFGWTGFVGVNASGYSEVNIHEGAMVQLGGGYGCRIGACSGKSDKSVCSPTGVVNVAGTARVEGNYYSTYIQQNKAGYNAFYGLLVGGGYQLYYEDIYNNRVHRELPTDSRMKGIVNIAPTGSFLLWQGMLAVGIGTGGDGEINIDGGTFTKARDGNTAIGMGGGKGAVTITGGGRMDAYGTLFIGGVRTNDFESVVYYDDWYVDDGAPASLRDAEGTLRVVNGVYRQAGGAAKIVVGAEGTGMIEIGSNGVVQAEHVVMSNGVQSVLRFVAGANGFGYLDAQKSLSICDGQRVEVDLTEYAGSKTKHQLVKFSGTNENFRVDVLQLDAVFTDESGKNQHKVAVLRKGADGLYLNLMQGTVLHFK